jgi:hypothetical protein
MNKKLLFTAFVLLIATIISWQRSKILYFSHQSIAIKKDKRKLEKDLYTINMEIRELAPPSVLYKYWKENLQGLDYHQYELNKKKSKAIKTVTWNQR